MKIVLVVEETFTRNNAVPDSVFTVVVLFTIF